LKNIVLIIFVLISFGFASPSADKVSDLANKHKSANNYHDAQHTAFKNSKTILSKTLLTQSEIAFEAGREANLIYSEKLSEGIYEEMKNKKYMFYDAEEHNIPY
jgi:hypothetical protein